VGSCTPQAAAGAGAADGQALAGAGGVQVADPGVTAALLQLLTAGAGLGGVSDLATPLQVGLLRTQVDLPADWGALHSQSAGYEKHIGTQLRKSEELAEWRTRLFKSQVIRFCARHLTPLTVTTTSAAGDHLVQALLAPPRRQTQTQVQYKAALAQYHVKRRQQQAAGSMAPSTGQPRTPAQPLGAAAAATASLPMSLQQQQQQQQPQQQQQQTQSAMTAAHVPSMPAAGAQLSIFQRAADLTVPEALPVCSDHSDAGAAAAVPGASASSGSEPADGLGLVSMAYGSDGGGDGGSGIMDAQSGDLDHDTPNTAAAAAPLAAVLAAGGGRTMPAATPAAAPGTTVASAQLAAGAGSGHSFDAAAMLHLPCGEARTPPVASDAGANSHAPEAEAAETAAAAPAPVPTNSMPADSQPADTRPAIDHASAPAPMDTDSGGTAAEECSPAHGGCSGDDELPKTAAPAHHSAGSNGAAALGGEAADSVPEAVDGAALPLPSTPASAGLTTPDPQPQLLTEPHTADSEAAADIPSQPVPASGDAAAAPQSIQAAAAGPFDTDAPPADLQQPMMGHMANDAGPVAETPDIAAAFARGDRKKLLRMLLDLPLGPSPREVISGSPFCAAQSAPPHVQPMSGALPEIAGSLMIASALGSWQQSRPPIATSVPTRQKRAHWDAPTAERMWVPPAPGAAGGAERPGGGGAAHCGASHQRHLAVRLLHDAFRLACGWARGVTGHSDAQIAS
jgi:hypothetical protein